ncbi:uncharacterized protein EI97DRAFT_459800 [Westerdykella ornata]|uniref:Rhodopsin domain-containing protein n=1 Tax=Westerdykella ornata TaxID=318751 RepID=A0A6A6JFA2_WESOR|nr:uncharacterized protein EI97DRAFT_459800 [Westerdykella ornata]KAF2274833.1 hypothetical protein EI97DRAFT_459800 [Westerdykella ornata]
MPFGFPNLTAFTYAGWPQPFPSPATRGWYSPYAVTLASLAIAVVIARLISQARKSTKGLGIEDLFACLALIFCLLYAASTISGALAYGFNRHMWDVPDELYRPAALVYWLSETMFILSAGFVKISVLCFYRRLEPPCTAAIKKIIWVLMIFTTAYTIGCLLGHVLLCHPVAAYWDVPSRSDAIQGRACGNQQTLYLVEGPLDLFSTLYCIIIPALVLRNLPMSSFQRNGFHALVLVSLSALGAAIARAVFLYQLTHSVDGDATWRSLNVFACAQFELSVSLACASAPFLQRFASQYPRFPIVDPYQQSKGTTGSVVSRVSSSLSGQIKRLPFARNPSPRITEISSPPPRALEIPEWEFEAFHITQRPQSPIDEQSYDRYLAGMYGPPAPPKDIRQLLDQYRREHGEIV